MTCCKGFHNFSWVFSELFTSFRFVALRFDEKTTVLVSYEVVCQVQIQYCLGVSLGSLIRQAISIRESWMSEVCPQGRPCKPLHRKCSSQVLFIASDLKISRIEIFNNLDDAEHTSGSGAGDQEMRKEARSSSHFSENSQVRPLPDFATMANEDDEFLENELNRAKSGF